LGFGETLPLLSFVVLRGRCRACGERISVFHPVGELTGALAGAVIVAAALDIRVIPLVSLAASLLAAAIIDARTRILPDVLTMIAAGASLWLAASHGLDHVIFGLIAASISGVIFLLLRKGFAALRDDAGLGLGDVKLFCALALWLGFATPWMVFGAAALGLVALGLRGRGDGKIAFGPMIAVSGFVIGLLMEGGVWPELL
jgi:leader peptidase (prepilin peptidase)/N-methyltransferase